MCSLTSYEFNFRVLSANFPPTVCAVSDSVSLLTGRLFAKPDLTKIVNLSLAMLDARDLSILKICQCQRSADTNQLSMPYNFISLEILRLDSPIRILKSNSQFHSISQLHSHWTL